MKLFILLILTGIIHSCSNGKSKELPMHRLIEESLELASVQSMQMAEALIDSTTQLPFTNDDNGNLVTCKSYEWVSGFFPGTLWYLYENDWNDNLKNMAINYTFRVEDQKYSTTTHDLGFMIYCSFGNAYRLTGNPYYKEIIKTTCNSLITRFNENTGCIRSWDFGDWQYPVIIDNLMNLEMLEWASKSFNNPTFSDIANSHAQTTMKNHFREDNSSYHVVSYDTITGQVEEKTTAQGYSNSSAWARGQGWGLYGYTMMYRETGVKSYLKQAEKIAEYIINHPNLPEDKIPYWDFDAPDIPNALRDASAGAVISSALIELSGFVSEKKKNEYLKVAEKQIRTLSSPEYRTKLGECNNYLLKHSVGHLTRGDEVDKPLNYADYYYVEALLRMKKLIQ